MDRDNDRVQYFDKGGNYLEQWGSWDGGGETFQDPTGISVHPVNGDVYNADRLGDQVIQFEADGTYVRTWGSSGSGNGEFDHPNDVQASPVHGVFVADTGNNRIQRFSDDGNFIEAFGSAGGSGSFSGPKAITVRMSGVRMRNCYVHNFTLDGEPRQITVFYTHDSGLPRHHIPDVNDGEGDNIYAKEVAEQTEQAWRTFNSYGLKDPKNKRNNVPLANGETGDDLHVWMFGETLAGRCCHGWGYSIKARHVENSFDNNGEGPYPTVLHELFHSIQFNHGYGQGAQPGFHWEGGAANAEDKVDAGLDDDPGTSYMGRAGSYLRKSHQSDLRDLKYVGDLFWTYFQEQLTDGSMSEPAYGIEVTDTLMRDILTDYRGLDGVAQALHQMDDKGRSLEEFWIDFTVANYVKDYNGADSEHRYVDDDTVPLLHGIQVRPGDGEIGIVYTPHPDLDSINIYRRRPGSSVWDTVVTGEPVSPGGVYADTTAANGLDCEYRLVPVIPGGYGGAPIGSVTVTAGADTDAPEGTLTINDGAPRTSSKRVTLSLDFDDDTLEMRLSNDGDFSDDAWETVASSKEWDLADDVASGEVAVVYVQFRDAEGNVGFDIYQQDSILYERPTLYLPLVVE